MMGGSDAEPDISRRIRIIISITSCSNRQVFPGLTQTTKNVGEKQNMQTQKLTTS